VGFTVGSGRAGEITLYAATCSCGSDLMPALALLSLFIIPHSSFIIRLVVA